MSDRATLLAFILGCQAIGLSGAAVTDVGAWYERLAKPSFQPPPWVFGPVWTILYALMGWSGHRVWRRPASRDRTVALWLFGAQLAANALWSPLFFGLHAIGAALVDIGVLLGLLIATVIAFARVDRPAAWLLSPYLAWVTFATALNASLWVLNRGAS